MAYSIGVKHVFGVGFMVFSLLEWVSKEGKKGKRTKKKRKRVEFQKPDMI